MSSGTKYSGLSGYGILQSDYNLPRQDCYIDQQYYPDTGMLEKDEILIN